MDTPATVSTSAPPTPSTEHPSLAFALLAAQRRIRAMGGVPKSDEARVDGDSYRFASGDAMIAAAGDALLAEGLLWSYPYGRDKEGKPRRPWRVERADLAVHMLALEIWVEHPATEERREYLFEMPISSASAADKALAGAVTYATSYGLRGVLNIPRPADALDHSPDRRESDEDEPRFERKVTPSYTDDREVLEARVHSLMVNIRRVAEAQGKPWPSFSLLSAGALRDDDGSPKAWPQHPTDAELDALALHLQRYLDDLGDP